MEGNTPVEEFLARWSPSGGAERANYQLFLSELCDLLGLPRPDPARPENGANGYVFEHQVTFHHGDGSSSSGYIDLYRRGCFVLEAKQGSAPAVATAGRRRGVATRGTAGWDNAMLRARGQAEQYARALPAAEGRPPFVVVVDVGHSIELYSEFTRSGATYLPYPDPRSHRLPLAELRRPEVRERLRLLWSDPAALDPGRRSARVTRDIAAGLARLAQSLEGEGHAPELVSAFLMRCLFTMFAEDIRLLPERAFTGLLERMRDNPSQFVPMVRELWLTMNFGGLSLAIGADLPCFNGGLFADATVLPLTAAQIGLLIEAARADWREVEPAIFGTLLERALDPRERHKLGAHYTPRAYVERLVLPTVIEPLRRHWEAVQAAAYTLDEAGRQTEAVAQVKGFHHRLCQVRVLDPACGSGNFLYVTLEHLKRLEGEVLNTLVELGEKQQLLDMGGGVTVDPHQLLGLEVNPRAAAIAEMVLWIGYLQWRYRTHGPVRPVEPVIRNFHNIECRDAVLAWDAVETLCDERGVPVTRWDGRSYRPHPATGEPVPDESARIPIERYLNPRPAEWPEAEFVVGNPPFIGDKRMRQALGEGYVDALRTAYRELPDSIEYVLYWWHNAARGTRQGRYSRFGFITTNSVRHIFNRRILEAELAAVPPLSLVYAIPDHPWADSADGADVRIAMTVGEGGHGNGTLQQVVAENPGSGEGMEVELRSASGRINADLSIGADTTAAVPLLANGGVSGNGVMLAGAGFIVTPEEALRLGLGRTAGLEQRLRHYRNGRDLNQVPRGAMVIDLFGLTAEQARTDFPTLYQWLLERVKPERDQNNRPKLRDQWWLFGEPRSTLRRILHGLPHYIATVETSKHRVFIFLERDILPDHKVIAFGSSDPYVLGILSSRVHVAWALAVGGTLEDRPCYNKSRCFETFPFPAADEGQRAHIRALAAELDDHRRRQQAAHPELTLTGLYNVLEKLRSGEPLTAKERTIHEQGLAAILRQLHDELDAAVLAAYGWDDLAPALVGHPGGTLPLARKPAAPAAAEERLLERLVELNARRAAEEREGVVQWLRPEYQCPGGVTAGEAPTAPERSGPAASATTKRPWPKGLAEQAHAVRDALSGQGSPLAAAALGRIFERSPPERLRQLLDTLVALGQARRLKDGRYAVS